MIKFFTNKKRLLCPRLYKLILSNKIERILLGDLGEGTKDATIKTWYKKVGDSVKEVILI